LVDGLASGETVVLSVPHSEGIESSGFAFAVGPAVVALFPDDWGIFGVAVYQFYEILCVQYYFTRLINAVCLLYSVVHNYLWAFSVFGNSGERVGLRDEGMGFAEFAGVQLELSEGRTVIGDAQIVHFWGGGFVLVETGVHCLTALSVDSVVEPLEFHDALDGVFAGAALNGDRFLGGFVIGAEHIIIVFVILELKIEILDDLVGMFDFFVVGFHLKIHFLFDFDELLDFGEVLCAGGTFSKEFFEF
jgi:hypothetical protein